jgi:acetyl-CoA carboxylase biotin carboxyl carrier protein
MGVNGVRDGSRGAVVPPPAGHADAELEAVQRTALTLLAGLPGPPTSLRLRAGAVAVEIEWAPGSAVAVALTASPAAEPPPPAETPAEAADHIHAPTVGVFYQAPEPGAPPFVAPGDVVAPGQQVAIVEAMKLMIPVTADRHGRIVRALLPDGAAVEFGERLFVLEPVEP